MKNCIRSCCSLKKILYLSTVGAIVFAMPNSLVLALSSEDLDSIYTDSVWYDNSALNITCNSPGSGNGTTPPPGNGAPNGAQYPNLNPTAMANAINTWIVQRNPNSAMRGLGSTIVASARNSNVSPFLITVIAAKESSMADPDDYNVRNGSNSFGRTAVPGQPSFQGDKTWYWWSSVRASVDHTAPENVSAQGGGDMATFLRNRYPIDSNNLTAIMMIYAPPDENNTELYIQQIEGWIAELVSLTNGGGGGGGTPAPVPADPCGGIPTTCVSGGGTSIGPNAEILCEARRYQGIFYQFGGGHIPYSQFRQNCPIASLPQAVSASTAANPGPCATDCSSLVSVSVNAAYNQSYSWSVSSGGVMEGGGANYWQNIPIQQAQAGDIVGRASSTGHVEIVVSVNGNTITTFGSHSTGTRTGQVTSTIADWNGAFRWTGPGSNL